MNLNLTLMVQVLFFAVFVWFSKKFVWTPLIGALHQRQTQIADGLAAAEKGQAAEQQARDQAEEVIVQAKEQAKQIVANAEKRGTTVIEEAKTTAGTEKQRIIASAQSEVEQDVHSAREALRTHVSSIAVAAAGKIVGKEIDESVHTELLEDLVQQLQAK